MTKPKILHLITGLHMGGAEAMLIKMLKATAGEFQHDVISLKATPSEASLANQVLEAGATLYECKANHVLGVVFNQIPGIRKAIKASNPDLIQCWMYHANVFASTILPQNYPYIWNIRHSIADTSAEKWLTRKIINCGAWSTSHHFKGLKGIIYNSAKSAKEHEALGYNPALTHYIPNGFDLETYKSDEEASLHFRAAHGFYQEHLLIGRIGRNHKMKDNETLFKAFAIINKAKPMSRLILAGHGMDTNAAEIMNSLKQLGIVSATTLLGARKDIHKILPALDVMISSSSGGEAFPNVIGEAMACEIPVVATDVGDCARIMGSSDFIAPPRDVEKIAALTLQILNMDKKMRKQLGSVLRERVSENYSQQAIARQYCALWNAHIISK